MLKEVTIEEAIKILEECDYLVEPMIVRGENNKDMVFIDLEQYNDLMQCENTDTITIKIDSELKAKVEEILDDLGLTIEKAVNIFLYQVVLCQGIPFEIKIPKK